MRAAAPPDAAATATCTEYTATVGGIDVSKYQGVVNWPAVQKAGVGFAFIRVSDGLDSPDEHFAENWTGARAAGLLRGAYQYFRPSEDAVAQAVLFLQAVQRLRPGDLPPVLDVETLDDLLAKEVLSQIQKWLSYIAKRTGRTPILYTNSSTWTALGTPNLSCACWQGINLQCAGASSRRSEPPRAASARHRCSHDHIGATRCRLSPGRCPHLAVPSELFTAGWAPVVGLVFRFFAMLGSGSWASASERERSHSTFASRHRT